jgi:hypothetical protein
MKMTKNKLNRAVLQEFAESKDNPAPRIGTAHPKRRSQITKKAPSPRLVSRRVKNTRKGYFPNPVGSTHSTKGHSQDTDHEALRFFVQMGKHGNWATVAGFSGLAEAQRFADKKSTGSSYAWRIDESETWKKNPIADKLAIHKQQDKAHVTAIGMLERIEALPRKLEALKLQAEVSFAQGYIVGIKDAGAIGDNEALDLLTRLHEILRMKN